MKKFFMFAAAAMMILSVASCKKDPSNNGGKDSAGVEVKTAAENLVVYLPLESEKGAVVKGQGISFQEKKGAAGFAKGMIGQAYTNTANNNDEAYLKLKVETDNAFKTLEDITVTLWAKNNAEFFKGALFSLNGTGKDPSWPGFVMLLDNHYAATGEQPEKQGVNGRFMFSDADLWLDTIDPALAKYDKWFQFAFTYDHATGNIVMYVDGVKFVEKNFDKKYPVKDAIAALTGTNALYVGAWSTFVETGANGDWQRYFAGSIDEIRIFNKALSATEIDALYKEEVKVALAN